MKHNTIFVIGATLMMISLVEPDIIEEWARYCCTTKDNKKARRKT